MIGAPEILNNILDFNESILVLLPAANIIVVNDTMVSPEKDLSFPFQLLNQPKLCCSLC